jgi:hypothetical protein
MSEITWRMGLWLVFCVSSAAFGAPTFEQKYQHLEMAYCAAFYTLQARTSNGDAEAAPVYRAANRVRQRLSKEVGADKAQAMVDAALFTWEQLSSVISDAEWERINKTYNRSCLDSQ